MEQTFDSSNSHQTPARTSDTHHYMAEAYMENTAVPHIRNCRHIRWLYPTVSHSFQQVTRLIIAFVHYKHVQS